MVIFLGLPIFAQWSTDFNNPLLIDAGSTHIDVEVVSSDGYFTFTWAKSTSNPSKKRKISIYDYKGYHLDFNDNPFSTEDYQVINNSVTWRNLWSSANSGSFLTQLMRKRDRNKHYITVLRIDENGNPLWSLKDDIYRQGSNAELFYLAVNDDDEAFLGVKWDDQINNKIDLTIYKINSKGKIVWSHKKLFFENSFVRLSRDVNIIPSNEGGCFVSYTYINQEADETGYSYKDSYAVVNKFDSEGNLAWDSQYILDYRQYGILSLKMIKDDDDNLYCIWDGDQQRIQKVHTDGYSLWQEEGIAVIDWFSLRGPILFEIGEDDDIRVIYSYYYNDIHRLYGQSITKEGELLWGTRGRIMIENPYSLWGGNYKVGMSNDTILVACSNKKENTQEQYQTEYQLFDTFGNQLFDEPIIAHEHDGMNFHLVDITTGSPGQFLVSWFSSNGSNSSLMAQSVSTDGSPGIKTSIYNQYLSEDISFIGYNQISRELIFKPCEEELQFQLTSLSGQNIKSGIIKDRISVPNISSGIYVLSEFRNNYLIKSHKLLINSL